MAGTIVDSTLTLTTLLSGVAVLVQSAEYVSLRRTLSRLRGSFSNRIFVGLIASQILLVILGCLLDANGSFELRALNSSVLFICTLLISLHFRGSFNGGADSMTLVVLSGLSVALLFTHNPQATHAALLYIAVQSLLSYLVAGFAKLRKAKWRSGQALANYLQKSSYDVPSVVRAWSRRPALCFASSWALMLFEFALLPALFDETALLGWMALGALFHLTNFAIFGLNRFFFIWISTYPALYYLGDWIWQKAS